MYDTSNMYLYQYMYFIAGNLTKYRTHHLRDHLRGCPHQYPYLDTLAGNRPIWLMQFDLV